MIVNRNGNSWAFSRIKLEKYCMLEFLRVLTAHGNHDHTYYFSSEYRTQIKN